MPKSMIPISRPNLTASDFNEIKKCFDSTWISSKSPWVDRFEEGFARKVSQTKYAVAVNSGTSALFLALKALGIGPGDEVIIPAFTMIATVNAIILTGAKPVLVDSVSRDDWNMDPEKIKSRIGKRTKAIMPVHIYGYSCDIEAVVGIARKHGFYVIEDSAESMGTSYKGRNSGSFGDVSCFSLYSNKIITSGNGGVVCTNNKKVYSLLKKLEFFDYNSETHFKHSIIGFNFVLSGLQAALGVSQLKRFGSLLAKRRKNNDWYRKHIRSDKLRFIEPRKGDRPNYWFPAIIFNKRQDKLAAMKTLEANGVELRDFFLPLHLQPVFKNEYAGEQYPISEYFFETGLLLPSYFELTESDVKRIAGIINKH